MKFKGQASGNRGQVPFLLAAPKASADRRPVIDGVFELTRDVRKVAADAADVASEVVTVMRDAFDVVQDVRNLKDDVIYVMDGHE